MSHDKEKKGSSSETKASVNNKLQDGRNGYGTSKDSFATLGSQTQR